MNKKNILLATIATVSAIWFSSAFANIDNLDSENNQNKRQNTENIQMVNFKWKMYDWKMHGRWKMMMLLTEDEKKKLESMTNDQKKDFFESKKTEMEVKMKSYEAVIDKLLAWETLTSDEENIRKEIIEQRAQRKVRETEHKNQQREDNFSQK